MTIDEPFTLGCTHQRKNLDHNALMLGAVNSVEFVKIFRSLLVDVGGGVTPMKPTNDRLSLDKTWPLDTKLKYMRERRATAMQMWDVRKDLQIKKLRIADCINLQRFFECTFYDPVREFYYYPVIDSLLGTGVPRAFSNAPELDDPQIVINYGDRVGIFSHLSPDPLTELLYKGDPLEPAK